MPHKAEKDDKARMNVDEILKAPITVYRFVFVFIYILFAAGFVIQVFVNFNINYLYIFELDPTEKLTHWQLYKVASLLTLVMSACFACNMTEVKLDEVFKHLGSASGWFIVATLAFVLLYCLQPCLPCGYRLARYELAYTLW